MRYIVIIPAHTYDGGSGMEGEACNTSLRSGQALAKNARSLMTTKTGINDPGYNLARKISS
jgi:hypothetical protein